MEMDQEQQKEKEAPVDVGFCGRILSAETKKDLWTLFSLSWPISLTDVMQVLLFMTTSLFCGRLGDVALAVSTISVSLANFTGVSVASGMNSAMDTLCSQAFGANNKMRVGVIMQRAILIVGLICFPVWALWINTENILSLFVEDPLVAKYAGTFMNLYIPVLPMVILFEVMQKYLQAQEILRPMLYVGFATNVCHVVFNYVLIVVCELGLSGAAIALDLSTIFQTLATFSVIKCRNLHKDTWNGWSKECLLEWGLFFQLAFPGMLMLCLEWWSFEVGTFVMGTLGTDILAAQGVIMEVCAILWLVAHGIGIASCILVGIHLGEGRGDLAKKTSWFCVKVSWVVAAFSAALILSLKDYIGPIFTDDRGVNEEISRVIFIIPGYMFFDYTQTICSGIVRGCGYQKIGAVINCISYDLIGLPIAIYLALNTSLRLLGFWIGVSLGLAVQSFLYTMTLWRLDWQELSKLARERAGITGSIHESEEMVTDKEANGLVLENGEENHNNSNEAFQGHEHVRISFRSRSSTRRICTNTAESGIQLVSYKKTNERAQDNPSYLADGEEIEIQVISKNRNFLEIHEKEPSIEITSFIIKKRLCALGCGLLILIAGIVLKMMVFKDLNIGEERMLNTTDVVPCTNVSSCVINNTAFSKHIVASDTIIPSISSILVPLISASPSSTSSPEMTQRLNLFSTITTAQHTEVLNTQSYFNRHSAVTIHASNVLISNSKSAGDVIAATSIGNIIQLSSTIVI